MLMVFQLDMFWLQYSKMSVIIRIEGLGGKMYMPLATYSFRTSFWTVPPSMAEFTSCFCATAMYMARRTLAGAFMVMLVVTLLSGMPSKRVSMSRNEETLTPTLPTSPKAIGWSQS